MKYIETLGILGVVILVILILIIGPMATIWSWNTLFGTFHTIEVTFDTWLAVVILGFFFTTTNLNSKK
jgi:uncharacterized membrane protein